MKTSMYLPFLIVFLPASAATAAEASAGKSTAAAGEDVYKRQAYEDHDFRTMQMLDWFVKEQGEEEKNASDMITKMELFGDDAKGLYMLNSEMAGRSYSAPSLTL